MGKSQIFFGRNPLVEALRMELAVEEVYAEGPRDQQWARQVLADWGIKKIPIRSQLPQAPKGVRSQGIAFRLSHDFYVDTDEIDWDIETRVLFCNHLEDVQNLGALSRAAAAFGFSVVVHESQRSVSMNEAALRSSMGLAFRLKFVEVSNLLPLVLSLQKREFQVVGLEADGEASLFEWEPMEGSTALVMGSESQGISKPVAKKLDLRLRIPMAEGVDSLNVSQAGAIAMSRIYSFSAA